MLKGFRDFILRGNVVDLAVAVILGAAFSAIVASLVGDILNPLLAAIVGKPDFSYLVLDLHGGKIKYGNFLNAVIAFLMVAGAIYFGVVLPINKITARAKGLKGADAAAVPTTRNCPECLSEIPLAARRCAHCAQPVA
jgi:large conductance mechanosensitive channel